jgi:recombination protein RecT
MTTAVTRSNAGLSTIGQMLLKAKPQIASVLPKHMTFERLARIAMVECRKNPTLIECSTESLIGAVLQAAQLGLEPGGALGHCYLVPFKNRYTSRREVQLILGYRGMIDLARRSGQISTISANVVYENDSFSYQYGAHADLVHVPTLKDRGAPVAVYAAATMKDGGFQFVVMSVEDVEKVRRESKQAEGETWREFWDEMAAKSCLRKLYKLLPVSIEVQRAVTLADQEQAGLPQQLDAEFALLEESPLLVDAVDASEQSEEAPTPQGPAANVRSRVRAAAAAAKAEGSPDEKLL